MPTIETMSRAELIAAMIERGNSTPTNSVPTEIIRDVLRLQIERERIREMTTALFQTLDGAVQFVSLAEPLPLRYQFALIPRLRNLAAGESQDRPLTFKHRNYEYMGKNAEGVPFYREIDDDA